MIALDSTDLRLLTALQADCSITNRDLAAKVHLSQSSCLMRVRKLEAARIITAYHARIDLNELCRYVKCLVTVSISGQTQKEVEQFQAHVAATPEILECYTVSGTFDFLLKVVTPDMPRYLAVTDDLIQAVDSEVTLNTHVVMHEIKSVREYPLESLL